jgi:choline trimethylamine-lyase
MDIVSQQLKKSPRIEKGLESIHQGRFEKKQLWQDDLSVLDEKTVKLPLVLRKALAIKMLLAGMPVGMSTGELIVGRAVHNSLGMSTPFPEYATKEEIATATEKLTGTGSVFGHLSPSHARIMKYGIGGLKQKAENGSKKAEKNKDGETKAWYQSIIVALEGLEALIGRYGKLLSDLMRETLDANRKSELAEMAGILTNISTRPPETFREALQLFWFSHIAMQSTMNFLAVGRFDQYMWPFLKEDLESGRIDIDQAQELVDCLWLKFNERLQSLDLVMGANYAQVGEINEAFIKKMTATIAGAWSCFLGGKTSQDMVTPHGYQGTEYTTWLQTIPLGGLRPDGKDGTNPLTYICLNSTYRLKLPQPSIYVRLHDNSPKDLYERSVDCIKSGLSQPTILNDEIIIKGLVNAGFSLEHARDYTTDGCWEIHIQGRTCFKYGLISGVEALIRALFPGRWDAAQQPILYDEKYDPYKDVTPPDPGRFNTFDEVMVAFKTQLDLGIRGFISMADSMWERGLYDIAPLPLLSALMEGPMECGRDITKGGAKYSVHSPMLSGLSHTVDSLVAIKRLSFEEKKIFWPDFLAAVENDFSHEESLRQRVMTLAPAYGNDNDFADNIAKEIVDFFVDRVKHHADRTRTGVKYLPGIGTFELYTIIGQIAGATPDGRHAHEPVSSNASPSVGRATSGQTAAINSYLKLPLESLPTGAALDIAMDERLDSLHEPIIRSFIQKRGSILNISVNNVEKLKAAQKEPGKYRDLKIRIGGWEAYFVDLPGHYQDFQIKKLEQYVGTR